MQDFDTQAELIKLGRLLSVKESELAFLGNVSAADLRTLRQAMSHSLFNEGRGIFRNMAKAAKLLPQKILVRMTLKAFGPVLSARVAGEMEPGRAIALAAELPADFLADITLSLDPESSRDIIRGIPLDQVMAVTEILLAREEFITMARFVDALNDEVLAATMETVDDAALLHIGFFVEDKVHLNKAIRHLSDARLDGMVHVCEQQNLWPEILALMEHMDASTRMRLANVAGQQEEKIHLSLLAATEKEDMWPLVLDMVDAMEEAYRPAIANLAAEQDDALLIRLFAVAKSHDKWPLVLNILAAMTEKHQQHMAELARRVGENPEQRRLLAKKMGLLDRLKPFLDTYAEA